MAWQTVLTLALSIPIPNALVATITRTSPDMNRSWVVARTSRRSPAWYTATSSPSARAINPATSSLARRVPA